MSTNYDSILLVDDDLDDQLLFREALFEADNAIQLIQASDGIDALELLHAAESFPALIFMDVNMPRMNGIDCLSALQQNELFRQIPVVMYSTAFIYRDQCLASGAKEYIEKPHDFNRLCQTIKAAITAHLPR